MCSKNKKFKILKDRSTTIYLGQKTNKFLDREQVKTAVERTVSNSAAARYCRVSRTTWQKYASMYICEKTGKNFYELHNNQGYYTGPKITKAKQNNGAQTLYEILDGKYKPEKINITHFQQKAIASGYLAPICCKCGFSEKRVIDGKVPLKLHLKDNNRNNFRLENLELLCFNCSFLYRVLPTNIDELDSGIKSTNEFKSPEVPEDLEINEFHKELINEF